MTADAIAILRTVFTVVWKLFTEWNIPGTNTNPASWFMFLLAASIGIRHLKRLLMDTGEAAEREGRFQGGNRVR